MNDVLLSMDDVRVTVRHRDGLFHILRGVQGIIRRGEVVGIVGESGSGKSQLAMTIMGLGIDKARTRGAIYFNNQNLLGLDEDHLNHIRGDKIAMIFQDPMSSLNPYLTIGIQMCEGLVHHHKINYSMAFDRACDMLEKVRIPDVRRMMGLYPHQISGGMRQRVMIAMALLCEPDLLIADEPTTALDVTVQADILDILKSIRDEFSMSIILISHDFGVVASLCDRVMVMYAGRIVEEGPVAHVFERPLHPYTKGLLKASLGLDQPIGQHLDTIYGNPPLLNHIPRGCAFHPRCVERIDRCMYQSPDVTIIDEGERGAECHLLSNPS